jgi:uncharacterized delta-60 repeat protein
VTPFEPDPPADSVNGLAIQPDGKIVAVGVSYGRSNEFSYELTLVRYNADGSLDPSFGAGGKVFTDFGDGTTASLDFASSVALAPDGKIVVAGGARLRGTTNDNFALARYNADGSLDATFGSGGKVVTDLGGRETGTDVALAPGGKTVVVGSTQTSPTDVRVAAATYNQDGTLDNGFDGDGKLVGEPGYASNVVVQPTGKLVLAGMMRTSPNPYFTLSRLNKDGRIDTRFGNGGKASVADFVTGSGGEGLAEDSTGRLVAVGSVGGPTIDFALARFDANGRLDPSFGNSGKMRTDFGGTDSAEAVALGADGKIVAGGTSNDNFAVARYLPTYCVVPNVKGQSLRRAKSAIVAAHCQVGAIKRTASRKASKGRVLSQKPAAKARRSEGAKVRLRVSR